MVHEQHARIRAAQPDTSGRRRADETDPMRHGADKGLRGDSGGLGIPHARYRARGVGSGYARKMEVSRGEARPRCSGRLVARGRPAARGSRS